MSRSLASVVRPPRRPAAGGLPPHPIALAGVAVAAATLGAAGPDTPAAAVAIGLAGAVAVVGMPHGGLDHRYGRAVFGPSAGTWWPLPFLTAYLAVAAAVVVGWSVAPLATTALFFLVSAAHFAETESGPRWRATLFGGMVIWLPLLARPAETVGLLGWVAPAGADFASAATAVRPLVGLLAGVAAAVWVVEFARACRRSDAAGVADGVRLAAFAGMFCLAPVLVSFAVAFAGWHSWAELNRLARRADPEDPAAGLKRVLKDAAPLSLLASLLCVAGALVLGGGHSLAPAVVQAVFVGLSAVAVPHILLHAVAARRGADPFAGGGAWLSTTSSPAAASRPG